MFFSFLFFCLLFLNENWKVHGIECEVNPEWKEEEEIPFLEDFENRCTKIHYPWCKYEVADGCDVPSPKTRFKDYQYEYFEKDMELDYEYYLSISDKFIKEDFETICENMEEEEYFLPLDDDNLYMRPMAEQQERFEKYRENRTHNRVYMFHWHKGGGSSLR